MGLKIGEVAERGGVNLQTIRYYERERRLPTPPRLASGYRMFCGTPRPLHQARTGARFFACRDPRALIDRV